MKNINKIREDYAENTDLNKKIKYAQKIRKQIASLLILPIIILIIFYIFDDETAYKFTSYYWKAISIYITAVLLFLILYLAPTFSWNIFKCPECLQQMQLWYIPKNETKCEMYYVCDECKIKANSHNKVEKNLCMNPDKKKLKLLFKDDISLSLVIQFLIGGFSGLSLDGGILETLFMVNFFTYWSTTIMLMLRARTKYTKGDLIYIKFGILINIPLVFIANVIAFKIKGYG
ncbi:hypothetical protein AAEX28_01000 [Lentisphaerota bacterium WC36G]|nr:hypothetical protein LJT99_03880 [Lentisphaerae bacterium WC36]